MSEYIITDEQLDALFAWIDELLPIENKRPERANLYKRLEVPRIVRCRDCKRMRDWTADELADCYEEELADGWCMFFRIGTYDDFFCAWGERKEDGD